MPEILLAIFVSVMASSGFWIFIQRICDKKDVRTKMLIGLGHDRILYLGMKYIERGWITKDEYENLRDCLYIPYEQAGGNGSARRIMQEVDKLPIRRGFISSVDAEGVFRINEEI